MTTRQLFTENFMRGLSTTHDEEGLPFPAWAVFERVQVDEGGAKTPKGKLRRDVAGTDDQCLDFGGGLVTIPLHDVHTLGLHWSFQARFSPDTSTGDQYIWGTAHATDYSLIVYLNSANNVVAKVQDSAGTITTLTSSGTVADAATGGVLITRNAASLVMHLSGVAADGTTGTMSETLLGKTPGGDMQIGQNNSTSAWDGKIDEILILNTPRSHSRDWMLRWLDPRADMVLANYFVQESADNLVYDRSPWGNTGLASGTASNTTGLSHPYAPMQAAHAYRNGSNERKMFLACGGRPHLVGM